MIPTCGSCAQPSAVNTSLAPMTQMAALSAPVQTPVAPSAPCGCKGHDWYDWLVLVIGILVLVKMTDRG